MLSFGFLARVKIILGKEFGYQPHTMYSGAVKQLSDSARQEGLNEYDAAIRIMLQMMYMVVDNPSPTQKSLDFVTRHAETILTLRPKATAQAEILDMLQHVLNRAQGGSRYAERAMEDTIGHGYTTFDSWFSAFLIECEKMFPELKSREGKESILHAVRDYIDQEPLKAAFNDGKHPQTAAEIFGPGLSRPFANWK